MRTSDALLANAASIGNHRWVLYVRPDTLAASASALMKDGMRLALVAAHDDADSLRAVYLFAGGPPDRRVELLLPVDRERPSVPSLSAHSFVASRFEREMRDLFGVIPLGHPQPRRLVLHQHWPEGWYPMLRDAGTCPAIITGADPYPFAPVEGNGVYEIPVGPVHAGLIEPAHFRFWAVGESILRMKARLWYVHKGIEKLFEGATLEEGLALAERISGDTAVGHGIAFCMAVEDAFGLQVPPAAHQIRSVLLELERIYNHVADLGAICNDVAFGFAHSYALRLRERLLTINSEVTGHRLLRGGTTPGGARVQRIPSGRELNEIAESFERLVDLATSNSMVMERFDGTATLSTAQARDLGAVGPVARASGLEFDARVAHPFTDGLFPAQPAVHKSGDVMARFLIRIDEVRQSLRLIAIYAGQIGNQSSAYSRDPARRGHYGDPLSRSTSEWDGSCSSGGGRGFSGVGLVEGWRGVIAQRLEFDASGCITRAKIVDPSFMNWPTLPVALADTIVPDFPLANKSFNLSYAGNDL